jgi:hypothetical protein
MAASVENGRDFIGKWTCAIALALILTACSSNSQRGIADRRSDFHKFLPMTGDPARYGLKPVRPFFRRANRAEILGAIDAACTGRREGSSVYRPETQSGYYVNCNPSNRQLLNGYVSRDSRRRPSSR